MSYRLFDREGREARQLLRERLGLPNVAGTLRNARNDPNAFVSFCFSDPKGGRLRQASFQRDLQKFLGQHHRALIELPRDHGKSTQICARTIWELGHDPSLRIKIVCATEGIAVERGRFLREAIAENDRVQAVFPNLQRGQPWTETRFSIERPASVIGPSITALGVGAGLTGTRADLLICDDIVDVKSLVSRAERDRVKSFFRDNLMNLLEPDGRCWCLFTPWHRDDLNAELKSNRSFAIFRRAVQGDFEPIWPERWPSERLHERKEEIGAASFARGYRLLPLTEETAAIRAEWIQFWTAAESVSNSFPLGRPNRNNLESGSTASVDRVILAIDPAVSADAKADASALVVLGARYGSLDQMGNPDRTNEIRCLDAIACRVRLPELVARIEALDRKWDPQTIVFESNAAFGAIRDLLTRHSSFGPKIREIVQNRSKALRVETFSVPVQNGVFRLLGSDRGVDPSQQALFDEMTTFPVGEHDDLLDAAAMGTEYLLNTREPRVW